MRRLSRALFALALCGCAGAERPPLRVGAGPWAGTEPLFLARERGALPPGRVHLAELMSAASALGLLRAGAIDAAVLPLDDVLRLAQRGPDVRVVAVLDVVRASDAAALRPSVKTRGALEKGAAALGDRPLPLDMLVVRHDRLLDSRAAVRALLDGWYAGVRLLRRDREASIATMARRLRQPPPQIASVLAKVEHPSALESVALLAPAPQLLAAVQAVQEPLAEARQLRGPVDLGSLFDARTLAEARRP